MDRSSSVFVVGPSQLDHALHRSSILMEYVIDSLFQKTKTTYCGVLPIYELIIEDALP